MEYSGTLLRNTREKKHLSLDEAHKHTKIPKEILSNIEVDRIGVINPVYLKGYLKIYAKYLGLDVSVVLAAYKGALPKEERPILVYGRVKKDEKKPFFPQINFTVVLNVLVILFIAVSSVIFIGHYLNKKKTNPSQARVVSLKRPSVKKPAPPAKKEAPPQKQKKSAVNDKAEKVENIKSEDVKLAIHAKDNTFLQVKADNNSVFQGILKKGQTESWSAKEKIELSIGSAASVDLEVNGKILPSLGRKKQVVNLLISRDGIQAR